MNCPSCGIASPFSLWQDHRIPSCIVCPSCGAVVDVDTMRVVVNKGE